MGQTVVYLSLGTNLGDRRLNLERALLAIEGEKLLVTERSSIYETAPQDVADQPWFLNMAVGCQTSYVPLEMLSVIENVERELGRVRNGAVPRGPRIIDIDILLFGDTVLETEQLTIPHPRMMNRLFVLAPLLEIDPRLRHPVTGKLLAKSLRALATQQVTKVFGNESAVDDPRSPEEVD